MKVPRELDLRERMIVRFMSAGWKTVGLFLLAVPLAAVYVGFMTSAYVLMFCIGVVVWLGWKAGSKSR